MDNPQVTRIAVATESPYEVLVGRGLVGELVPLLDGVRHVAVIAPPGLTARATGVREHLDAHGFATLPIEVPDSERAKTAAVAESCWRKLGRAGFTRSDAIIGLGGGSTTDVAGFVAATFLRGIRVVNLPTSLLGMVDAAIGGKTGINTAEGKNLVGCFHEPHGVICDLATLETLPPDELTSGLAEVVKCGFIADPEILELIDESPAAAVDPSSDLIRELVERSVRVKASVVARDLRESTSTGSNVGREALNYGHTLGHAVERVEDYRWRHGAAISIGMVFVAELACIDGRIDRDLVDRHRSVLARVGLPTAYQPGRWEALHDAIRLDKKARGDLLRFVVLDAIARPAILEGPSGAMLQSAYAAISGASQSGRHD